MKTALITGASSGIGKELAYLFARDKHSLVLVARNESALKGIASEITELYHVEVLLIIKDLQQNNAALEIYNEIQEKGIQIDFLVNNAGFGDHGALYETNWEKEHEMIEVNITALTYLTKLYAKEMVKKGGGKIMNLASTAAFQPGPMMAIYYASKAYVLSFTEAIANELKNKNITVTALCPGPTQSGFQTAANIEGSRLFKGRRIPTAAEVARYGYRAMMDGKVVAIHGFINNLLVQSLRFAPRGLITGMVRWMNGE